MKKIILLSTSVFLSFTCFAQHDSIMNKKKDNAVHYEPIEMYQTDGIIKKKWYCYDGKKGTDDQLDF